MGSIAHPVRVAPEVYMGDGDGDLSVCVAFVYTRSFGPSRFPSIPKRHSAGDRGIAFSTYPFTERGCPLLAKFWFVFCRDFWLAMGLHSGCSTRPTISGSCQTRSGPNRPAAGIGGGDFSERSNHSWEEI